MTVGDVPQPLAEIFHLDSPGANTSWVSGAREITEAMHSALEGENSGMEPGGDQVSRQKPSPFYPGDPLHLVVYIDVADSVFHPPLVFFSGPSDSEFGQIKEIGPEILVRRLHIEEGPLPVLAGLDDVGALVLGLAGSYQTAAGVGHVKDVGGLAAFYSRRSGNPCLSIVSSEVEKPFPQGYAGAAAEIPLA